MRGLFLVPYVTLISLLVVLQIFLFLRGPGSHGSPSSSSSRNTEPNNNDNNILGTSQQGTYESSPRNNSKSADLLINTSLCKIITVEPFHDKVLAYLSNHTRQTCPWSLVVAEISKYGILKTVKRESSDSIWSKCCYREITREQAKIVHANADWLTKTGPCIPIPAEGVPVNTSYIRFDCETEDSPPRRHTDFVASVLPPNENSVKTNEKVKYWEESKSTEDRPPNILFLTVNGVSRLQMMRTLDKTRRFAFQNDFVELKGYTKVGENNFANMMATLGGMPDMKYPCWRSRYESLDKCPFIWKNFSESNYVTGLIEDTPGFGIFHYGKVGFYEQPVDYTLRPLLTAVTTTMNRSPLGWADCVNGGTLFDLMFNYLNDFLREVAGKVPYFMVASFKTLKGYEINAIREEDENFEKFLSDVITNPDYDGNNTVIVLQSNFGKPFNENEPFEEFYESALPMLLIRLPPSLKQRYPEWVRNLEINSERLVQSLDVYTTLVHLHSPAKELKNRPLDYSYSLFEEIPEDRTCQSAQIPLVFCRCGWIPMLTPGSGVDEDSQYSVELGQVIINHMNAILAPVLKKPLCSQLSLIEVLYGQVMNEGYAEEPNGKATNFIEFFLGVKVYPSEVVYEGLVREYGNSTKVIVGDVVRVSPNDGESYCVREEKFKPYCSCFEHNLKKRIHKLQLLMKKSAGNM